MSWNYRRVKYTHVHETLTATTPYVMFGVTEVFYDDKEIPNGYVDPKDIRHLTGEEKPSDINGEYDLIKGAFDKPILDLDNFPNEYTE